ncbi:MAG TPA: hypothetical protein VHZ49_14275, partial [Methylomirabilota bacterium]|nr:hypothetical protein [Methylomirabilota bacterium]
MTLASVHRDSATESRRLQKFETPVTQICELLAAAGVADPSEENSALDGAPLLLGGKDTWLERATRGQQAC